MRDTTTTIAIVGGGLAGSLAAATLGRAGISCILIDPAAVYPPDYRVEKIGGAQLAILAKTGLSGSVLRSATRISERWIARFGRLIDKTPNYQHGIMYEALVNTVRAAIPPCVTFIPQKVTGAFTGPDRQHVVLSSGEEISARLIVLATGLNHGLRKMLGVEREVLSRQHSLSVGFDMKPAGRSTFPFPALDYYAEHTSDRTAYITLFPIRSTMRANLFMYRDPRDPWLRDLRDAPQQAIFALMPGLKKITGNFEVTSAIDVRPADLYVTKGYHRAGMALVGDSFGTSCPVAGTGVNKVFTDVERLCNVHIPNWLASPGMGADKIAAYYDDPAKQAADADSLHRAYYMRSISLDDGLIWHLRRWHRFLGRLSLGILHAALRGVFQVSATRAAPGRVQAEAAE
jgi:2-polyprenyl-6-methoxyphenol hydroxylase-like FAD-dependent oxidoreductase